MSPLTDDAERIPSTFCNSMLRPPVSSLTSGTGPTMKVDTFGYARGRIFAAKDNQFVVTSFGPRTGFDKNTSIGGHPAKPMVISELGDGGTSNWEFTNLMESWRLVGQANHMPHVQSSHANGRIHFRPGQHSFGQGDMGHRSVYMPEWFQNRQQFFKFGVANGVMVLINLREILLQSPIISGTTGAQMSSSGQQLMNQMFPASENITLLDFVIAQRGGANNPRGP